MEKDVQKVDRGVTAWRNLISIGLVNDTIVPQKSHSLYYFHCLSGSDYIGYYPVVQCTPPQKADFGHSEATLFFVLTWPL